MNKAQNRRETFRRYADRRLVALLELHEVIFNEEPGPELEIKLFDAILQDYQIDRIAVLTRAQNGALKTLHLTGDWGKLSCGEELSGPGISKIIATHDDFTGALTLSKFRKSSLFEPEEWQALWSKDLFVRTTGLLSVPVEPKTKSGAFLWLLLDGSSREWSSHDRDLSEEEALLLAKVIDKGLIGLPF